MNEEHSPHSQPQPAAAQARDDASARREQIARLCKALGHPARVAIVEHLRAVDRCVCGQIVDIFPLAQSTVSQHLKILKDSGIVIGEIEGPRTCYCLDKALLERFKNIVAEL